MESNIPKISVLVFTYNRDFWIERCISSILNQDFKDFEIIVADNCSTDNTEHIVKSIKDKRITYIKNEKNLGLPSSMNRAIKLVRSELIFLMADDDVMCPRALSKVIDAFKRFPECEILTRSYKMYSDNFSKVIRVVPPPKNFSKGVAYKILANTKSKNEVVCLMETLGQVSGIVIKKNKINLEFHPSIWITHNHLFCKIFGKTKSAIYLNDEIIKVELGQSISMNPIAYDKYSPIKCWAEMLIENFNDTSCSFWKKESIKNITSRSEGLVQVRCYGGYKYFLKETFYYLKFNKKLIFNLKFLFYFLLCLFFPRKLIIQLGKFFKFVILKNYLKIFIQKNF